MLIEGLKSRGVAVYTTLMEVLAANAGREPRAAGLANRI